MLKKVLLMAAVVLLGLPGLAHAQLGRGEISVGYGVAPVTDWIDAYSDKLLDVLDTEGVIDRHTAPAVHRRILHIEHVEQLIAVSVDPVGQLHLPYRRRVGCGRYFRLFG